VGASIGSVIAWWLAGNYPQRVATLACINVPHPMAIVEVKKTNAGDNLRRGFSYLSNFSKEGDELKNFKSVLKRIGPEILAM
jgi:pimeloyl-ACP methyl ester carboxylesterase